MDLSFDLKTVLTVEIDGQRIDTDGGKQLYIDGVHVPSVLEQMWKQRGLPLSPANRARLEKIKHNGSLFDEAVS